MNITRPGARYLAAASTIGLSLAASTAFAQLPSNPEAERRAAYTCPKAADNAQREKQAAQLRQKSYDKNALACALDFRFEVAKASPADLQAQLNALQSLVDYIDHVRALKMIELVQMNWAEYAVRFEHAEKIRGVLVPAALQSFGNDASVIILSTQSAVLLAGPNEPQVRLDALEKLKRAIALDPKALDGEAQTLIGRIYLDLPTIYGGGADKALPYLQEARKIAPGEPRTLRYLAEAYDELGQKAEASGALEALASSTPPDARLWQLYCDEWRMGEGLATRMGDEALAKRFGTQRTALLDQHPELLRRNVETVFGHGGSNPVTGEPQYAGEGKLHETPKRKP
jgi:predicted Zn-dependent protease